MSKTSPLIALCLLVVTLGCGGLGSEPSDDLHQWTIQPGPGEPPITLRLILDDRIAVFADEVHRGELAIPRLPKENWTAPETLRTDLDLDSDGLFDLAILDPDKSSSFNHSYRYFRYDSSSRSLLPCEALQGQFNGVVNPVTKLFEGSNLEDAEGMSGSTEYWKNDQGCSFERIGTITWEISPASGHGTAICTPEGATEAQWRMPTSERPTRACPEPPP